MATIASRRLITSAAAVSRAASSGGGGGGIASASAAAASPPSFRLPSGDERLSGSSSRRPHVPLYRAFDRRCSA